VLLVGEEIDFSVRKLTACVCVGWSRNGLGKP